MEWTIFNSAGQKSAYFRFHASSEPCMQVTGLAPGVYWVKVDVDGRQELLQKIVVKK
jgi:hypothetical protein